MNFTYLVFGLITLLGANKTPVNPVLPTALCGRHEPTVYDFSTLYRSDSDKDAEIWLDEHEKSVSGLQYANAARKFRYLSGYLLAANKMLLCRYAAYGGPPTEIMLLTRDGSGWQVAPGAPGTRATHWTRQDAFQAKTSYGVEYRLMQNVIDLPDASERKKTCRFDLGTFDILNPNPSQKVSVFAVWKQDIEHNLAQTSETCVSETGQEIKSSVQIIPMFIGEAFISSRALISTSVDKRSNLHGSSIVFATVTGKELKWSDIFKPEAEARLTALIQHKLRDETGSSGRFHDLKSVNVSFSTAGVVFSFAPVDSQGFYLHRYFVEVPISWFDAKVFLKIVPR